MAAGYWGHLLRQLPPPFFLDGGLVLPALSLIEDYSISCVIQHHAVGTTAMTSISNGPLCQAVSSLDKNVISSLDAHLASSVVTELYPFTNRHRHRHGRPIR